MKVLHLSTFDIVGGAARGVFRIHQGMQSIGVNSQILVQKKAGDDPDVISLEKDLAKVLTRLKGTLTHSLLQLYPHRHGIFSPQFTSDSIASHITKINPDVINLNWVCNEYLQIETLAKLNKPLIWTLHDMWPFTGGCHYNEECERYTNSCGACPQLRSNKESDLSRWVWQRKTKAWKNLNLTIVAPSTWIAESARASSLFRDLRIEVIPPSLSTLKYKPIDQRVAREVLNLPQDKQLVLFGAISATTDTRKGFHLLLPALQQLSQSGWNERIELVVFGSSRPKQPINLGFKTHYLGQIHDDASLALVYSAADVMIVPSIQESFGQTASESLACGTPVVAFNATGLKDIVDHKQNGYLVKPFEVEDLAGGISWVLEDIERHQKLSISARKKAEKAFSLELQAQRYLSLCEEILNGCDHSHILAANKLVGV